MKYRKHRVYIIRITVGAILLTLSFVLKKFSIDTGFFRISLFDTPLVLAGMILGGFWGMLVAFGADFLYSILSGYAYSFLMMFSALAWGLAGGFFYQRKLRLQLLLIVVLITAIFGTIINSVQLYLWNGIDMWAGFMMRFWMMIIKWPLTTFLVYLLYQRVVLPLLGSILNLKVNNKKTNPIYELQKVSIISNNK